MVIAGNGWSAGRGQAVPRASAAIGGQAEGELQAPALTKH
jgi:hypothetical protein